MTRWSGWLRGSLFAATLFAATLSADSASAWCWRGGYGFGWRPFCGPGYSYSYAASSYAYGFGCFAPRVFSYSCYTPYAYRCYPYSYNLGCYPYWNGWGWNGWGCGPFVYNPVFLPSAYAPVYGPAGVFPYLGVVSTSPGPAVRPVARNVAAAAAIAATPAAAPSPVIRSSNTETRMRAGRLVAIGDRHMQSAVSDRASLAKALDAYRRAAKIASDQPDTFLRQAIVLAAMDRSEACESAIARAVAIDGRLGDDPAAARDAARRLPPAPAFGLGQAGGQNVLAARTNGLLERIFRDDTGTPAAANWIAARWNARIGGPAARLAAK